MLKKDFGRVESRYLRKARSNDDRCRETRQGSDETWLILAVTTLRFVTLAFRSHCTASSRPADTPPLSAVTVFPERDSPRVAVVREVEFGPFPAPVAGHGGGLALPLGVAPGTDKLRRHLDFNIRFLHDGFQDSSCCPHSPNGGSERQAQRVRQGPWIAHNGPRPRHPAVAEIRSALSMPSSSALPSARSEFHACLSLDTRSERMLHQLHFGHEIS